MSLRPTATGATGDVAEWIRQASREVNGKLGWGAVPASASAPGSPGQAAYESGFLYICVATDTWKRVALATWP